MTEELLDEFDDVFSVKLNKNMRVKNQQACLTLVKNSDELPKPNVGSARSCPLYYRDAADRLIEELEEAGIIVKVLTPTEQTSPGSFIPKKSGKVRLVVDYRQINKHILRPQWPFMII